MGRAIAKPIYYLLMLGFMLQPNLQDILCLIKWSYLILIVSETLLLPKTKTALRQIAFLIPNYEL